MKIGVLGLGNIAQKAYLPLYSLFQDELEVVLVSRDLTKAEALRKKYGFQKVLSSLEELLKENIEACFVHTATHTHYEICKELLKAGIAVYVDKPISENLEETKELMNLAKKKNLPFFLGFNRRYIPLLEPIKNAQCQQFYIQKNRQAAQGPLRFQLYDLFIHVVDTAVYLLEDTPHLAHQQVVLGENGNLLRVNAQLETAKQTAFLTYNLKSGSNQEVIQGEAYTGTYRLENLQRLTLYRHQQQIFTPKDWESTLVTRGFSGAVTAFIQQVKLWKKGSFSFDLQQEKVLFSHELIEEILRYTYRKTI